MRIVDREKLHELLDRMLDEGYVEGNLQYIEGSCDPLVQVNWTIKLEMQTSKIQLYRDYV